MQMIQIGPGGPKVAPIGMGTWAWGDNLFWSYGREYGEDDLRAAYDTSLEAGVTFFDTAEIYGTGRSEALLGRFAAANTEEHIVASKFFPYPWRVLRGSLRQALAGSLRRLGLPSLQLYQIHWPFPPRSFGTWLHAMADAVEAGLLKQIGVSNFGPRQTEKAIQVLESRGQRLASNQISYSLLARNAERNGLLQLCRDHDITVIAYSPLAQGLLTGKYTRQQPPPDLARRVMNGGKLSRLGPLLVEMQRIATLHGDKPVSQVALNWCVAKGTLAIPGAKNAKQAGLNAGALSWSLNEEEVGRLDELSATAVWG
ncbi:MAG: aldo/keto reductase [Anaerolineales bacterium]|nr:MAG: aldo/keto reductase [Anaerolineales bacterium]